MKAETGTGKRILHRKKVPPPPDEKRGKCYAPCRVKVVADCNALGGYSGETYSRRGDPTITAYNGLGRRIRTRLVGFFLFFFLWSRQTPSRGGDLFSSLAKDLHRLPVRRKSLLSIAKGVEIKQRGEISYLVLKNSQSNHPLLLHYITLLGVLSWKQTDV